MFEDNDARGHGGAICSFAQAEITDCTFNRNYALNRGGSVYLEGRNSVIKNSNFSTSSCEDEGGAVYAMVSSSVENCNFMDCFAAENGGAIYAYNGISFQGPSTFINNRVGADNIVYANKGGAIYARTINSAANGLVFINNRAWYGGAVYINNKNTVSFESCYFKDNVAKNAEGTSGCGAAIYIDSTSSHITLKNNIFVDNKAVDDKAVYNCGSYDTVTNNWYDSDDPNFKDPYLVEWHRVGSDDRITDSDSLRIEVERDASLREFTINFVTSSGAPFDGKVTPYNVEISSDKNAEFRGMTYPDGTMKFIFNPLEDGEHRLTLKMGSYSKYVGLIYATTPGDFEILQDLINNANGVLDLTRNYTYTVGKDTKTQGILINKPLTINGNGYTINALGHSRIFEITGNNVKLDNIVLTNGLSEINAGAIYWSGENGSVSNSVILKNRGWTFHTEYGTFNYTMWFNFKSEANYINAIRSEHDLTFTNVTYWNGTHITTDTPVKTFDISGIKIHLKIFNETQIVKETTLTTENGQAKYSLLELPDGKYKYKGIHYADDYYIEIPYEGEFEMSRSKTTPTIQINMEDKWGYSFSQCTIPFTVTEGNKVRVLITNQNGTIVFIDEESDNLENYTVNLPASDEYYNITIFTQGNETHSPVSDSKMFRIIKILPNIDITPIGDVDYRKDITFNIESEAHSFKVTVKDINENIVFNNVTNETSVVISGLNVGEYFIEVISLEETNYDENKVEKKFIINKANNNIQVIVDDGVFGENVTITVKADVDGEYSVNINSTIIKVNVVNGTGSALKTFNAGNYYANVTFNDNCINTAENTTFKVEKAKSNIVVEFYNDEITTGTTEIIKFADDAPAQHMYSIYNSTGDKVHGPQQCGSTIELPSTLEPGEYTLKLTNIGNDNVEGSEITLKFNVTNNNYVYVDVDDVEYGRNLTVIVFADVDGTYVVDIGGEKVEIEVDDGVGYIEDLFDITPGNYTTSVTFDDEKYNNIVENAEFTIIKAESNIKIYDIESKKYGENITVNFYDDYPGKYNIIVWDEYGNVEYDYIVSFDGSKAMQLEFRDLTIGKYTISIENLGNESVEGNIAYGTFSVFGAKVIAFDMTRGYNSGEDFNAKLVDENNTPIANAQVTFTINGKNYTAVTGADGVASINPKLAVGTYTVIVKNPINNITTAKTLKIVTRITGNKNVNTYYGKNYQYKLRIIGDDGKAVGAGVAVKVTINGKVKTLKTDKNGYITVKFTKAYLPKTYTVKAEYKGIKVSNKIKVKKVLTLKKAKVKRSAKNLVLKATLKEGKKALKGKKVVFKFKGKKYTAKTNKKGIAKVKVKKSVLKKLKKGQKVKYQVTYLKHTVKRTAKVKR